ncbi:hypothetical protein [Enterococcus plantarum]|nr:hypothetical protein [Enterococcus plantarum]
MKRIGNIKNNYTRGENEYEKLTMKEKNEVKAGWVCVLWGAVCWG